MSMRGVSTMKLRALFTVVALLVVAGVATAASVEPVLVAKWKSGNAAFECAQAAELLDCDCTCDFAFKVDPFGEDIDEDGELDENREWPTGDGNVITILNSDGTFFDWESNWPVCCVIVKGGPSANIFCYPDGSYGDTDLYAPINPKNGKNYGLSHATFCYNEPEFCYEQETAWADGSRYVTRGNWAMYVAYAGVEKTVDLIAGQYFDCGDVTFSAPVDGWVTISVVLTGGCIFWQDDPEDPEENFKVQDYADEPSGNPAPGLFDWKLPVDYGETEFDLVVPVNNFYGVHIDVGCPVECPEE
jgi:hypothetical protein